MRVLLYDHDQQRNKRIYELFEDLHVHIMAAYSLKDFLIYIEKPMVKILLVEKSRVLHYNIDVEDLLKRLGYTFIVIVYSETETSFDFSVYYLQSYYHFPFITDQDKKIFKKIKHRFEKLKARKEQKNQQTSSQVIAATKTENTPINDIIDKFSGKQRQLIKMFFEKKEGISTEEIIKLLDAQTVKDSQNYVQTHIYRLRNRLNSLFGQQYIISYKNHIYRLLHLSDE